MEIKDLNAKQGNVDIVVDVVEIGETREFQKFGTAGRVANAKVKDATGELALTLWNDQIEQIHKGDKIQIKNGYVNEWQGEKQLTTGRFGTMEILESGSNTTDNKKDSTTKDDKKPEIKEEKIE